MRSKVIEYAIIFIIVAIVVVTILCATGVASGQTLIPLYIPKVYNNSFSGHWIVTGRILEDNQPITTGVVRTMVIYCDDLVITEYPDGCAFVLDTANSPSNYVLDDGTFSLQIDALDLYESFWAAVIGYFETENITKYFTVLDTVFFEHGGLIDLGDVDISVQIAPPPLPSPPVGFATATPIPTDMPIILAPTPALP